MKAPEKFRFAFLEVEEYYIALVRARFPGHVAGVGYKSFDMDAFERSWGRTTDREFTELKINIKAIMTENVKELILRDVDFQRPLTEFETVYMRSLMNTLEYPNVYGDSDDGDSNFEFDGDSEDGISYTQWDEEWEGEEELDEE